MEDLPTEILQQIAWLSLNPELYLVSKKITSKLPDLRQFEADVAAILFCDRSPGSAWIDIDPFPWQTSQAATSNYAFSTDERRHLQYLILTQSWFSEQKFRHLATQFTRLWLDRQWIMIDMPVETNKAIQDHLESGLFARFETFNDKHGNTLWFTDGGYMEMNKCGTYRARAKHVFEVLCYPLKLFVEPQSPSKQRFFQLFHKCQSRDKLLHSGPPASPPQSVMRKALDRVIVDGDLAWFRDLYYLTVNSVWETVEMSSKVETWAAQIPGEVETALHQLVRDVLAAILRGRKWKLMEDICETTRLPNDYLESQLVPALTQAISDGDLGAREFQQWVECGGWAEYQDGQALPEWYK